jgi:hypothetical protein
MVVEPKAGLEGAVPAEDAVMVTMLPFGTLAGAV